MTMFQWKWGWYASYHLQYLGLSCSNIQRFESQLFLRLILAYILYVLKTVVDWLNHYCHYNYDDASNFDLHIRNLELLLFDDFRYTNFLTIWTVLSSNFVGSHFDPFFIRTVVISLVGAYKKPINRRKLYVIFCKKSQHLNHPDKWKVRYLFWALGFWTI